MNTETNTETDPLLTADEVAYHKGIRRRTVERWKAKGCPWHPVGLRGIRFRMSEVDRWLLQQRGMA